jgi:hypothetical protein
MKRRSRTAVTGLLSLLLATLQGCSSKPGRSEVSDAGEISLGPHRHLRTDPAVTIERGRKLVSLLSCDDCHSPKVLTPAGLAPDPTRLLSGHPARGKLPPVPSGVLSPNGWGVLASTDFTAWAGPWGVSFASNLTPDPTGIGTWNANDFIQTLQTGQHFGTGRPILPPMPVYAISKLNDDDLRAIFAYLQTIKPVANQVPPPIPLQRMERR